MPRFSSTSLKNGKRQLVRQRPADGTSAAAKAASAGDQQAQQEPHARRDALGVLLGHLGVVVGKADQAEGQRHEQHDPDIGIVQPRPEQRREHQRRQDQQAAHRRRARLRRNGSAGRRRGSAGPCPACGAAGRSAAGRR